MNGAHAAAGMWISRVDAFLDQEIARAEAEYLASPWPFACHSHRRWFHEHATEEERDMWTRCSALTWEDFEKRSTTWFPFLEHERERLIPEFTD